jgi:N-acetylglucosamine-6-phosphate deacetylase
MKKKIINAALVVPNKIVEGRTVEIEQGMITAISSSDSDNKDASKAEVIDAKGLIVTPGLIDIHIHGCAGADTMDASLEALSAISSHLPRHGVTSFYATTVTNSRANLQTAMEAISAFQEQVPGARLLGAHVEGPYINIEYKGAQNPEYFREPDPVEYHAWIKKGVVKLMTVAPEIPGAGELLRYCRAHNVELAIGHSNAAYDQVVAAADAGVRQATHLFNGMLGLHHRRPGTAGGALSDERIYAQVIVDGIHLHPAIVDMAVKLKGIDRTILITDAMRAAGLPDGAYELGGQKVFVREGAARIENGSLAGSTLMLDRAVRNIMTFTGLDFAHAVQMATRVPAEAMGIEDQYGIIQVGANADLAFFDDEHQVAASMVAGEFKYKDKAVFKA